MRRISFFSVLALTFGCIATFAAPAWSTPYASGVNVSGTTVNFILNEPSDTLTYSINGGAAIALDGTTKGLKTFNLGAASDTFSIVAEKNATTGFTIPNGIEVAANVNASSFPSNGSHRVVISDDDSGLTRFNSPRGVSVSLNPNAPNFGTAYISNSAVQTGTPSPGRTSLLGDGMYALKADGSDAYGFGDTAAQEANFGAAATTNTPFRPYVAADGSVYVAGFGDALAGLFRLPHDMSGFEQVFDGFTGPEAGLPAGQNHGSISRAHVTGSPGNNLTIWAIDEDLTTAHVLNENPPTTPKDRNSLWRWDIGNAAFPYTAMPVKVAQPFTDGGVSATSQNTDLAIGADGKFYMSDFRSAGTEPGFAVVNPNGTVAFDSLVATRALANDPLAADIYRGLVGGMALSPDQKWVAGLYNNNQIVVTPLVDGIPDIANRLVVDTDNATVSARGIAFDAAGNIHYVSSGQGRYRVLAAGGNKKTTLSWNGTTYAFSVEDIVAAGLLGDFDEDNDVDAADYVFWRENGANALPNDNGAVDADARYNVWKANFGNTLPAASAGIGTNVPEPAALLLFTLALAAVGATRRRA